MEIITDGDGCVTHRCYEVEVGGPLKHEKILRYILLWLTLDESHGLRLELVTVDRYGVQKRWDLAACAKAENDIVVARMVALYGEMSEADEVRDVALLETAVKKLLSKVAA